MDPNLRSVAKSGQSEVNAGDPAQSHEDGGPITRGRALAGPVPAAAGLRGVALQTVTKFAPISAPHYSLDELRLEQLLAPAGAEGYYEEMVANFNARDPASTVKTVMFISTNEGEGCSTTAFNFAVALSRNPRTPVLFIDADFRTIRPPRKPGARLAPSLSNLGQPESDGLLPVTAVRNADNLFVVPSGDARVPPFTLFRSPAFDAFLSDMSRYFAHIVIDAPPLQNAPESLLLAGKADGVILVLDCMSSRRKVARRLTEKIRSGGGKMLGAVLNRRRYYIPDWLYAKL